MILRRETKSGSNDLNVVFRPCLVDEMLGNETNRKYIRNALNNKKVPHTQLYIGEPGLGKTTAAKIVALGLNCEVNGISSKPCLECQTCKSILEGSNIDIKEVNVGQTGGKDYIDAIIKDLPLSPFKARYKVVIFDEAHELTKAAKDLLLKPIETGYDHVYFIFCTNQPDKLRSKNGKGEPFLDRCSILEFNRLNKIDIKNLLQNICEFEGFHFNKDVIDLISEEAKGVPRNAIVWLNQVAIEGSWTMNIAKEICKVISNDEEPVVFELCRALNNGKWKEAVEIFESINTVPVETLRITVAGYFVSCLKKSKKFGDGKKYSAILDIITTPIYEQGKLAEHKWYNYMFKIVDVVAAAGRR